MALNPFIYPDKLHVRTQDPPQYSDYRKFKPVLKEEFGGKCVYCRDSVHGHRTDTFGVDHYRPKKHFPELVTTYSNLFFSCNTCNRRKGAYWPTPEEFRTGRFLPNPCEHRMTAHLRTRGARIETLSNAGVLAEELLMLNEEELVRLRERVLFLVQELTSRRGTVEEQRSELQKRIHRISSLSDPALQELKGAIMDLDAEHTKITEVLESFGAR